MAKTPEATYRELSDRLEAVLAELQADDVDVDKALALHEQGSELIKQLEARLTNAEHKITQLKTKQ